MLKLVLSEGMRFTLGESSVVITKVRTLARKVEITVSAPKSIPVTWPKKAKTDGDICGAAN